jgi:hypothetical protein
MKKASCKSSDTGAVDRRRFLGAALGACVISTPLGLVSVQLAASLSGSLTKEQRDSMAHAEAAMRCAQPKIEVPGLPAHVPKPLKQ